jgi:hypothetical protein
MHQPPSSSGTVPLQESTFRRDGCQVTPTIPAEGVPGEVATMVQNSRCGGRDDRPAHSLYGRASKLAMALKVPRPDGTMDIRDAALVRLAVDEAHDPVTGR